MATLAQGNTAGQMAGTLHQSNAMTLNGIKTCNLRPHITLNPYSTQLVESINLMMPNNNNSTSTGSSEDSGNGSENSETRNFRNSENSGTSTVSNTTTLGRIDGSFPPQLAQLTNTLRGGQVAEVQPFAGGQTFADGTFVDGTFPGGQLPELPSNGDVVYRAVSPHGHVY